MRLRTLYIATLVLYFNKPLTHKTSYCEYCTLYLYNNNKENKMDYSESLFTQLLRAMSTRFDEMEYDLLFQYKNYYKNFKESTYNDEERGEYDCMVEFLNGTSYIDLAHIMHMAGSTEDVYFITGLEYGVRDLRSVNPTTKFEVTNIIAVEFGLL